jgi:hypothetical protein
MTGGSTPSTISLGALGRFVVHTRRGRIAAGVYVLTAALLGLVLGLLDASELVKTIAVGAFAVVSVVIIFRQVANEASASPRAEQ